MYAFRASHGPIDLAFTDRLGGVSAAPYDSLNLAISGGDSPESRAANLRRVLDDFAPGARVAELVQVHGREVVDADAARDGELPEGDALVATEPDVVLAVRVADCVPVLLADDAGRVVAAAHAGRKGVLAGVVPATVEAMRARGAEAVSAWIGPYVCGSCYEVPAAMQAAVTEVEPATRATTRTGTPALDLGAGVRHQLERAGVTVHDVSRCTLESPDLFSHRRDGASAGRLAGLVRRRR
ncbi:peptidoglycan editing factor PgeF [Nocardioides sp. zg-DK7169]|uniref:peptidoglycan editing factor PgeF n=1 Tax=Nocardioides sp. zg-DK7169 TaxID=2736600 RepID=UPI0015579D29|nr:peptidoglycan editing factor PgeF [Nocardioides sp. zg-DK7169]NPC95378.1 peptidoglycan editing factor PgeF [Nocardioides sp. zg-DK7169]